MILLGDIASMLAGAGMLVLAVVVICIFYVRAQNRSQRDAARKRGDLPVKTPSEGPLPTEDDFSQK